MTLKQISKLHPQKTLRISGENANACWDRCDYMIDYRGQIYRFIRCGLRAKRCTLAEDLLGRCGLVDHVDRNNWNNTIDNLRFCSHSQNSINRATKIKPYTKFRGVQRHKNVWKARIKVNGRETYLGLFKTDIDAAKAYNEVAIKQHGEFAVLNKV